MHQKREHFSTNTKNTRQSKNSLFPKASQTMSTVTLNSHENPELKNNFRYMKSLVLLKKTI